MSLHVEITGQGPDLVFLHGWGMHGGVWRGLVDALAQDYRLHLVDLPGMGHSPSCQPYTLKQIAEVVAQHVPSRATLAGWSFGGEVAMQLALDFPERLQRLVLIGSTPCFVNQAGWLHGVAPEVFRRFAEQVAADYHPSMSRFLGLQAFGGESSRQQMRELREQFSARPAPVPAVLQEALEILLTTDLRQACLALQMPVKLIHGNRDTLAPIAAARWMAQHLPDAQLHEIAGASHAPFLSHPAAFLAALRSTGHAG